MLSGLTLAVFAGETSGWVIRASGRHVPSPLLQEVAMTLLAGGLTVEGLALLGWIIAPWDDRRGTGLPGAFRRLAAAGGIVSVPQRPSRPRAG